MHLLRIKKKTEQSIKASEKESRRIISSMYVDRDTPCLEHTQKRWQKRQNPSYINLPTYTIKSNVSNLSLLSFLKSLDSKNSPLCCSFLFNQLDRLIVVQRKNGILHFLKEKWSSAKIKYWISRIYFDNLQQKLTYKANEEIHLDQQQQYLPTIVKGKHSFPSKITLTNNPEKRRQGPKQQEPFCVAYLSNGSQQLLSFTQSMKFIDFPNSLKDISYIKIFFGTLEKIHNIATVYKQETATQQQKDIIKRLKIHSLKTLQRQKQQYLDQSQYQSAASLCLLEAIASIERKTGLVQQLETQWSINPDGFIYLDNVFGFKLSNSVELQQKGTEGLMTLYQKLQQSPGKTRNYFRRSKYTMPLVGRAKSEEAQKKMQFSKVNKESSSTNIGSYKIVRKKYSSCSKWGQR